MANRFSGNLSKTRRGAIIISLGAALLAALLLIVYIKSYRSSVNSSTSPERVLVARRLIPRGTSASIIASKGDYQVTTVEKNQLEPFAITDPSAISGRIAAADIYPGQQLVQGDFTTENASALNYQISGTQRAIAVPVDSIHGMAGEVLPGDYVDVYVSIGGSTSSTAGSLSTPLTATQVRLLEPDVLVLATPSAGSSLTILRVSAANAAKFAYVADYEKFWFILRPQTGASRTPPTVATLGSLLSGGG